METLTTILQILLQPMFVLWPVLLTGSYVFTVVLVWRIWKKVRHLPG